MIVAKTCDISDTQAVASTVRFQYSKEYGELVYQNYRHYFTDIFNP